MLSSVRGGPRAATVNIEIVRTFVRVRELAITHEDLRRQRCVSGHPAVGMPQQQ